MVPGAESSISPQDEEVRRWRSYGHGRSQLTATDSRIAPSGNCPFFPVRPIVSLRL
jgi:hypothetical protein